jgi:CheY-like chemotaxis protein
VSEKVVVLVVEDEILIAELIEHALVEGGYAVHREATGDVAHHARRLNPDIAVVYTSGDSGHAYKAEGVPGSTFVQKPFVPDQVTTAVSTLLNAATKPGAPRNIFDQQDEPRNYRAK